MSDRDDPELHQARFRVLGLGGARRHGYGVRFSGIGELAPDLGQPTQLALFTRHPSRSG